MEPLQHSGRWRPGCVNAVCLTSQPPQKKQEWRRVRIFLFSYIWKSSLSEVESRLHLTNSNPLHTFTEVSSALGRPLSTWRWATRRPLPNNMWQKNYRQLPASGHRDHAGRLSGPRPTPNKGRQRPHRFCSWRPPTKERLERGRGRQDATLNKTS